MFLNVGCNMRHRLLAQSHMHLRELHTHYTLILWTLYVTHLQCSCSHLSHKCKLGDSFGPSSWKYRTLDAFSLWMEGGAGGASWLHHRPELHVVQPSRCVPWRHCASLACSIRGRRWSSLTGSWRFGAQEEAPGAQFHNLRLWVQT